MRGKLVLGPDRSRVQLPRSTHSLGVLTAFDGLAWKTLGALRRPTGEAKFKGKATAWTIASRDLGRPGPLLRR